MGTERIKFHTQILYYHITHTSFKHFFLNIAQSVRKIITTLANHFKQEIHARKQAQTVYIYIPLLGL